MGNICAKCYENTLKDLISIVLMELYLLLFFGFTQCTWPTIKNKDRKKAGWFQYNHPYFVKYNKFSAKPASPPNLGQLTLTFDSLDRNLLTFEVWKWSCKNCGLYHDHKGEYDGHTDTLINGTTHEPLHYYI